MSRTERTRGALLGVVLAALALSAPLHAQDAQNAQEWFDLARYEELKRSDRAQLEFVLGAMQETIFYAQESIGGPVICATPVPIPGAELVALVDRELDEPSNPQHPQYADNDHVAFALVNALKTEGKCK